MPGFVRSEDDEELWSQAKSQVTKEYGISDGERFWKLANEIFHRMKQGAGSKPAKPVAKAEKITMAQLLHPQRHLPSRPGEPTAEALSWLERALARIGFGKAKVHEPGKRGGRFWYDEHGEVQYGEPPAGSKSFSTADEFERVHQGHEPQAHVDAGNRHIAAARASDSHHGAVMHEHLATAHFGLAEKKGVRLRHKPTGDRIEIIPGSHPGTQGMQYHETSGSHIRGALEEAAAHHRRTAHDIGARAAAALDATHPVGERGPRTLQARQRVAASLDRGEHHAGMKRDVEWLESVARKNPLQKATLQIAVACRELGAIDVDRTGRLVTRA